MTTTLAPEARSASGSACRYPVSLICPTYNERDNIVGLAEELFAVIAQHPDIDLELIVVDDNSPDGTYEVACELEARFPVRAFCRPGKLGLGSAVFDGFARSKRPLLGVIDGDLSHDPAILPALIRGLQHHDVTIGSRFGPCAGVENWPIHRKLVSVFGVALARRLTKVKDPLSGYFFVRRLVIDAMSDGLTSPGYKVLLEILMKGRWQTHMSIPYIFRDRRTSTSKLGMQEYLLFLKQIVWFSSQKLIPLEFAARWEIAPRLGVHLHRAE